MNLGKRSPYWMHLALACAAPWLGGCSFLFTTAPPSQSERSRSRGPIECTTSKAAPVVDTVFTGLQMVRIGAAVAVEDSVYRDSPISREADIGIGIGLGTLFLISAIYGYSITSTCAEAKWDTLSYDPPELPPSAPKPAERRPRDRAPTSPPGAFGLAFGASKEEIAAACRQSGHEWSEDEDAVRCSGTPSAGMPGASAQLEFADGRLSAVEVVIRPPEEAKGWAAALREAETALVRLYGKPKQRSFVVPDECKAAEQFLGCVAERKVAGSASWSLEDGRSVTLFIAGAPPPSTIRVRVTPGRPAH
jgi:hypothetical protein